LGPLAGAALPGVRGVTDLTRDNIDTPLRVNTLERRLVDAAAANRVTGAA